MDKPDISVVVPTFEPGDGLDRVIRSLDAQTLGADRFEVVFVDDGSRDDTLHRLQALADTRPNVVVTRIENSGWPSTPRNVGVHMAQGDWILFMDHDDSLYPGALARLLEFARETQADVVSPKESKTSDAWWGMSALSSGNLADVKRDGGIDRILPMVPHKLYRRAFLLQHGITFPEGRRRLWEDIVFNVEAWSRAERVAVLADTPVYLWHASGAHNSASYGPGAVEYWDRLDDLFAFIDTTLSDPESAPARRSTVMHQYRERVLTRLSRRVGTMTPAEVEMSVARARRLQRRYVPDEWDVTLAQRTRAYAALLRADRPELLAMLWAIDATPTPSVRAGSVRWRRGRVAVDLTAGWAAESSVGLGLRRAGGRLVRELPPALMSALPADVVDMTDTLRDARVDVAVRDRSAHVTWAAEIVQRPTWTTRDDGSVVPEIHATALLDPENGALGRPLDDAVYDFVARLRWGGLLRASSLRYAGSAAAAFTGGRAATAYASRKGALALDLSNSFRSVLLDGGITEATPSGDETTFEFPLPEVQVSGGGRLPAALRLRRRRASSAAVALYGWMESDGTAARFVLPNAHRLRSGRFVASFSVGGGPFLGERPARVTGRRVEVRSPLPPAGSGAGRSAQRAVAALLRRLRTLRDGTRPAVPPSS